MDEDKCTGNNSELEHADTQWGGQENIEEREQVGASVAEEGTTYYYTSPRKSVKEEWCRPMQASVKDARWEMPDEIVSENRPQFASDQFYEFRQEYDFKHITTSTYYPQVNGEADTEAVQCRTRPHTSKGVIPYHLMIGREIHTLLPTLGSNLKPVLPSHEAVTLPERMSNPKLHNVITWTRDKECDRFRATARWLSSCEVRSAERTEKIWERHCEKLYSLVICHPDIFQTGFKKPQTPAHSHHSS